MTPISDSITYKRNKLSTAYIDVPLELRYRTKPNDKGNSFKVALGVKGGFLLSNYTKFIGQGNNFGVSSTSTKYKKYDIPNIAKFRYGATVRIGYGPFNINAFYSLSPLFDKNAGPQITPISVGISFNGL